MLTYDSVLDVDDTHSIVTDIGVCHSDDFSK